MSRYLVISPHPAVYPSPGAVVDMEDMGAMMSKQREDPNTGGKGGSARNNRRYPGEVAVGGTWSKAEPSPSPQPQPQPHP